MRQVANLAGVNANAQVSLQSAANTARMSMGRRVAPTVQAAPTLAVR